MNFETENISVRQVVCNKKIMLEVEENVIIPDVKPDILKVLNCSGNLYITKKEIINGKLKLEGGVLVYVMYVADDEENNVRSVHTCLDFVRNFDLDKVEENAVIDGAFKVKSIECKILNGRKINVRVFIEGDLSESVLQSQKIIKNVAEDANIQMISRDIDINVPTGRNDTIVTAKDVVSVQEEIADILAVRADIVNSSFKTRYNKVLSKADLSLELTYITDKNEIKVTNAKIPIMGFIDMPNISEENECEIRYEMNNIEIELNNVEEKSINVEVQYKLECVAYVQKRLNLIEDLYSPEHDILLNEKNIEVTQSRSAIQDSLVFDETIKLSNFSDGKIYSLEVNPIVSKVSVLNNSIAYEGELEISVLYESNGISKLELVKQNVSFSHTINSEKINKNCKVETTLGVKSSDFEILQIDDLKIKGEVEFSVVITQNNNINIIEGVTVQDFPVESERYSISIYFVKSGDTLWKIAKKFRSTIEEIARVNNIEDVDNIKPGTRLYIPRAVSS